VLTEAIEEINVDKERVEESTAFFHRCRFRRQCRVQALRQRSQFRFRRAQVLRQGGIVRLDARDLNGDGFRLGMPFLVGGVSQVFQALFLDVNFQGSAWSFGFGASN